MKLVAVVLSVNVKLINDDATNLAREDSLPRYTLSFPLWLEWSSASVWTEEECQFLLRSYVCESGVYAELVLNTFPGQHGTIRLEEGEESSASQLPKTSLFLFRDNTNISTPLHIRLDLKAHLVTGHALMISGFCFNGRNGLGLAAMHQASAGPVHDFMLTLIQAADLLIKLQTIGPESIITVGVCMCVPTTQGLKLEFCIAVALTDFDMIHDLKAQLEGMGWAGWDDKPGRSNISPDFSHSTPTELNSLTGSLVVRKRKACCTEHQVHTSDFVYIPQNMETVLFNHSPPSEFKGLSKEEEDSLLGQVEIWRYMLCYTDSLAIKCVIELRIPDIIHRYGKPLSLSQIVENIEDAPSPDANLLQRVMTLMVRRKIFSAEQSETGETLYGLTSASEWILRDTKMTLAPLFLLENHPVHLTPAQHMSEIIREGIKNGTAFFRSHGHDQFELTGVDPEYNRMFHEGMMCTARVISKAVINGYKEGFNQIESLVDVGGSTGGSISEIVRAYPHIKGINFDLPHVVATAPKFEGVTHVGGDMFVSVPSADAIYMKWILHDWTDEQCIELLKNCRKAIPEKTGKVIIVDHVLRPEGNELFTDAGFAFDMILLAHNAGGKERTEENWKLLFKEAGFPRYNIIKIHAFPSLIEAFPI
ncbi:unnamed protein product [Sphenostylis stenocarpa]|uniref:Uncharacterized protein n=1 Tax=Sphenostylis stenocarpa TaxID=92480 RepID=A0AA86W6L2_9FABA|nr:unnamed protein product [Sphenostylis stenocarpa]